MENLGKFSVSNVVDRAPSGSLGVVLVPNGGSYSMAATTAVGGGGGGAAAMTDTGWVQFAKAANRGTWYYRQYGKMLFVSQREDPAGKNGAQAGAYTVGQLPAQYRNKISQVSAAASSEAVATTTAVITLSTDGTVSWNAPAAGQYFWPTLVTLID